jgi:hypothetical protein
VFNLIVGVVTTLAALFYILDYFGVKPKQPLWGLPVPLSRNWKLGIMLFLVAVSLGMSAYGFYRSLRPKIVEKVVEKTVEKPVATPCPELPKATKKSSPTLPSDARKTATSGINARNGISQQNQGSNDTNTQIGTAQAPIAIAPNGIANAAPNFGTQAVINPEPPLPAVKWTIEKLAASSDKKPGVIVHVSTDSPFPNAAFSALCDRPCTSVVASYPTGFTDSVGGNSKSNPNLVAVRLDLPRIVNAGDTLNWEVRSKDEQAIDILKVEAIRQW